MCFAPTAQCTFSSKMCSEREVFLVFLLQNVLRATTACNFSSLIWRHGLAPAALARLLFDPLEPQIIVKTQWIMTFLPFRAPASSFFSLFLLPDSSHFFSSPPWLFPPLLFQLSILSEVSLPKLPSIKLVLMDIGMKLEGGRVCWWLWISRHLYIIHVIWMQYLWNSMDMLVMNKLWDFQEWKKTGITLFGHSDILCRPLTLFKTKLEKNTQTCEKQSVSFHDEIQTDTVYAFWNFAHGKHQEPHLVVLTHLPTRVAIQPNSRSMIPTRGGNRWYYFFIQPIYLTNNWDHLYTECLTC